MPQYWVVGAMYDGHDDQFEVFIRAGYWLLGWDDDQQPDQARRRDQIRPGDRIAIKKRSARNRSNIVIRAVGFATGIDPENKRIYIRWVASDLHHEVYAKGGCFKSIHGPYSGDDDWIRSAFRLEFLEHRLGGSDLPDLDDELLFGPEGAKSWRMHLITERNRDIVERKKAQTKSEKGSLECEVCGFNFAKLYRDLGADFCEVHHKLPLAQLDAPVCPKLDDLAIICSNCHRMIHRTKPLMSIEDFRDQLKRWFGPIQPSIPVGRRNES
jgi:HNH endonuclease